jgi:predicted lipoprotein with Yx(FWY)xxD motif
VRRPVALGVIATAGLIVAGCGSSSKSATSATTTTAANAPAQSTSSTPPATNTATAGRPTVITAKHSKLGTILAAGPKHMTVYLFEGDKGAASSCSGACAAVWPPVTSAAAPTAGSGAQGAKLGVIPAANGAQQVSYNGHPLYFYARDGDQGDAYGQGVKSFGANWYVLAPSGSKVDKS